ncbi:MAG: ABC transporter substrate-binding protein [Chloroflexota bacterium]
MHYFRKFTLLILLALLLVSVMPLSAQETECEDGFRLFDHELLATDPVCVPESPERVAMMETVGVEVLFTLDIQPAIQLQAYNNQLIRNFPMLEDAFNTYFGDLPDGNYFEPNLEVLLTAEPDLIVLYDIVQFDSEQMNAIAPTVVVQLIPDVELEVMLDFHADLLGLEDEIAGLLEGYNERTTLLNETIGDAIADQSIVIARVDPQLSIFTLSPAYAVLRDAGWEPTSEFATQLDTITNEFAFGMRPVSMEEVSILDGDYLFAYDLTSAFDEDVDGVLQEITENPLWQTLSVVQEDRFYTVPTYWNFSGIISSHFIIDDLFTYFSDVDPQEVSPNPFLTDDMEEMDEEMEATEEASD